MRASEIIAASALVAAANAAPFCVYPFCGSSGSSSSSAVSSSSSSTSSSAATTSTKAASTSCSTSSSSVKVSSSSTSVAASASTSSTSVSSVITTSTSSATAAASTSTSSTAAPISTSSTSVSSIAYATSSAPVVASSTSSSTVVASSTSSSATAVPTVVTSDDGYNYQMCVTEPFENGFVNTRALQGDAFTDSSMTVDLCASYCSSLNYTLFGVEYADECYCGNSLADGASSADASQCDYPCAGDATEQCGGQGVFNLYEIAGGAAVTVPASTTYSATSTATATGTGASGSGSATAAATASATVVPSVGGFVYDTCAVDPSGNGGSGRALTDDATSSTNNMTVEICAAYCSNYAYFGVEYGAECYCGNTIATGTTQDSTNGCNMACNANSTELCGGSWHLNLYYNAANGGSAVVLPATYTYSTTTTSSVAASTTSVAASTTAATTTTSSAVVNTSSAAASTSSSAAASTSSTATKATSTASSSSAVTSSTKTTSTSVATTLATSTKTSSASATATAGTCAPVSTDLSTCPVITMNTLFGQQKFTNYYKGTGYTLSSSNPGNLLSWLFPVKTVNFASTHSICSAANLCMQQAGLFSSLYHSFDLHYRTDSCQWECSIQQGLFKVPSQMGSYFSVANKNVGATCGFSS